MKLKMFCKEIKARYWNPERCPGDPPNDYRSVLANTDNILEICAAKPLRISGEYMVTIEEIH